MPKKVKRVTHRTDNRGNLLEQHSGSFELKALAEAELAGVPDFLLDRAGWTGSDDLLGAWAEGIYQIGVYLSDHMLDTKRIGGILDWLGHLSNTYGIDHEQAMVTVRDGANLLREIKRSRRRLASISRGEELPLADPALFCFDAW